LLNCGITNNYATNGAGLYVVSPTSNVTIAQDTVINNNYATEGKSIYCVSGIVNSYNSIIDTLQTATFCLCLCESNLCECGTSNYTSKPLITKDNTIPIIVGVTVGATVSIGTGCILVAVNFTRCKLFFSQYKIARKRRVQSAELEVQKKHVQESIIENTTSLP